MAGEAKEFFQNIVQTSRQVASQINEIILEIEGMTGDIKEVENMILYISETAKQSSAGSQEVSASIEEQTSGLEEILTSASELAEMAVRLQDSIRKFAV